VKRLFTIVSLLVVVTMLATACGAVSIGVGGMAKAKEGTALRKIQDRGKIIIGVKYDVPLFGYLNPQTNAVEGFDVAMGKEIAKKIFGDEKKVEWKQAVSKDRIPFLQEDVVDLVISTMTVNADREQQILFSNVYYLAGQSLLVPKDSTITSVKGLAGKKVCSAKGSTSEANIRKFAPQAELILFDSYSECVTAMAGKRADAVSTDDNILLGFASQDKNLKLVGGQFSAEPYGMGIKKGNTDVQQVVNDVLKSLKTSGKWKEIFKKEIGDKSGVATPEPPIDDWREIQKTAPQP
jgi:putative glutamine transport system substrate-binding protein